MGTSKVDTDELREVADECHPGSAAYRLTHAAADEIDRLRAAAERAQAFMADGSERDRLIADLDAYIRP